MIPTEDLFELLNAANIEALWDTHTRRRPGTGSPATTARPPRWAIPTIS